MKKIKTLFERVIVNHKIVDILPNVPEECKWVLDGEGTATRKLDGTACMIKDGKLYARYDARNLRKKKGKNKIMPEGSIQCQEKPDEITGSFPWWVPVDSNPTMYKWMIRAFEKQPGLPDGTYEAVGIHFKTGNPESIENGDILVKHGSIVLEDVPRFFEGIREYLRTHDIEGIVFHRGNGDMCKIKRTDFGFMWNGSYSSR